MSNITHAPWTIRQFQEAQAVCNEVGLTPRQLAQQRAELLEALAKLVCEPGHVGYRDAARAAIAKATGDAP